MSDTRAVSYPQINPQNRVNEIRVVNRSERGVGLHIWDIGCIDPEALCRGRQVARQHKIRRRFAEWINRAAERKNKTHNDSLAIMPRHSGAVSERAAN